MEAPYALSFQDILDFCERLVETQNGINGICEGCGFRRACRLDKKERDIDGALHMLQSESRYPFFSMLVQKNPCLLYSVPAFVFERKYGSYHTNLPCPFQSEEYIKHLKELEEVYNMLTDEDSKRTLLNILLYRLTLNRDYILRAYSAEPQYFIEPFRALGPDEVYVDCGAYIGDTFEAYCMYNQVPKEAYLFEPDSTIINKMIPILSKYNDQSKIEVIEKGVYRKTGRLFFVVSKASESFLSETDIEHGSAISVTSIDDAITQNITFIKMDIEGSENDAIIGAERHILNSYPKLAVCVYHRPNDLWEIPLMIRERFSEYTHFVLRHHSRFFAETVLYAYR